MAVPPVPPVDPGDPVVVVEQPEKSWLPTRKWFAAQIVGLGAIATSWVDSGWDDTELKLLIGLVVQAAVAYLLPNESTPGGVPVKAFGRKWKLFGHKWG